MNDLDMYGHMLPGASVSEAACWHYGKRVLGLRKVSGNLKNCIPGSAEKKQCILLTQKILNICICGRGWKKSTLVYAGGAGQSFWLRVGDKQDRCETQILCLSLA